MSRVNSAAWNKDRRDGCNRSWLSRTFSHDSKEIVAEKGLERNQLRRKFHEAGCHFHRNDQSSTRFPSTSSSPQFRKLRRFSPFGVAEVSYRNGDGDSRVTKTSLPRWPCRSPQYQSIRYTWPWTLSEGLSFFPPFKRFWTSSLNWHLPIGIWLARWEFNDSFGRCKSRVLLGRLRVIFHSSSADYRFDFLYEDSLLNVGVCVASKLWMRRVWR